MPDFSPLQHLKQHIQRWYLAADKVTFLTKEIGTRLSERLDLIKQTPITILDASNIFNQQAKELLKRYSDATVFSTNIHPHLLSKPRPIWQRWQHHEKCFAADFHQLPLPDESIDFVFSNCLLYNSWDIPGLIHEWFRVLKPNGLLLFSSLGPDTLKELRAAQFAVQQSAVTPPLNNPNPFIDMHDIGDLLLHQGFSDPVMDMEMLTVYYQNFKQLLQEVRVNNTNTVPTRVYKKNYFLELEQAYKKFLTAENKLPVTCEIIYGHAWKLKKPVKNSTGEFAIPIAKIKR